MAETGDEEKIKVTPLLFRSAILLTLVCLTLALGLPSILLIVMVIGHSIERGGLLHDFCGQYIVGVSVAWIVSNITLWGLYFWYYKEPSVEPPEAD